jgi:hypothetical protein
MNGKYRPEDLYPMLRGENREVVIHPDDRKYGALLVGGQGTGKCIGPEDLVLLNGRLVAAQDAWERYATGAEFDGEGWWASPAEPLRTCIGRQRAHGQQPDRPALPPEGARDPAQGSTWGRQPAHHHRQPSAVDRREVEHPDRARQRGRCSPPPGLAWPTSARGRGRSDHEAGAAHRSPATRLRATRRSRQRTRGAAHRPPHRWRARRPPPAGAHRLRSPAAGRAAAAAAAAASRSSPAAWLTAGWSPSLAPLCSGSWPRSASRTHSRPPRCLRPRRVRPSPANPTAPASPRPLRSGRPARPAPGWASPGRERRSPDSALTYRDQGR